MCQSCGGASDFQAITVNQFVDEHKAKQNGHEAMPAFTLITVLAWIFAFILAFSQVTLELNLWQLH